jgi:hypothetical protein
MFKKIVVIAVILSLMPIGTITLSAPTEPFNVGDGYVSITHADNGAIITGQSDINGININANGGPITVTLRNVRAVDLSIWATNPVTIILEGEVTLNSISSSWYGDITIKGTANDSLNVSSIAQRGSNLIINSIGSLSASDNISIHFVSSAEILGGNLAINNVETVDIERIVALSLNVNDVKDFTVSSGVHLNLNGVINAENILIFGRDEDSGSHGLVARGQLDITAKDVFIYASDSRKMSGTVGSYPSAIMVSEQYGGSTRFTINAERLTALGGISVDGGDIDINVKELVAIGYDILNNPSRSFWNGGTGIETSRGNISIRAENTFIVGGNAEHTAGHGIMAGGTLSMDVERLMVSGGFANIWMDGVGIGGNEIYINGLKRDSVIVSGRCGINFGKRVEIQGASSGVFLTIDSPVTAKGWGANPHKDTTIKFDNIYIQIVNDQYEGELIEMMVETIKIESSATMAVLYPTKIIGNLNNLGRNQVISFLGIEGNYSGGSSSELILYATHQSDSSLFVIDGAVSGSTQAIVETIGNGGVISYRKAPLIVVFNTNATGNEFTSESERFAFEKSKFLDVDSSIWYYTFGTGTTTTPTPTPTRTPSGGGGGGGGSQPTSTPSPTTIPTGTPTPTPTEPPTSLIFEKLEDVNPSDWFYNDVKFAVNNGLFYGIEDNEFAPQMNMTRAMVITVLARNADVDTTGGAEWYSRAVDWGVKTGITDGVNLTGNITREQLATLLYRYADSPTAHGILNFTDNADISGYASTAIVWAVNNGIMTGYPGGTLNPQGNATRAEVASMIRRFINATN